VRRRCGASENPSRRRAPQSSQKQLRRFQRDRSAREEIPEVAHLALDVQAVHRRTGVELYGAEKRRGERGQCGEKGAAALGGMPLFASTYPRDGLPFRSFFASRPNLAQFLGRATCGRLLRW